MFGFTAVNVCAQTAPVESGNIDVEWKRCFQNHPGSFWNKRNPGRDECLKPHEKKQSMIRAIEHSKECVAFLNETHAQVSDSEETRRSNLHSLIDLGGTLSKRSSDTKSMSRIYLRRYAEANLAGGSKTQITLLQNLRFQRECQVMAQSGSDRCKVLPWYIADVKPDWSTSYRSNNLPLAARKKSFAFLKSHVLKHMADTVGSQGNALLSPALGLMFETMNESPDKRADAGAAFLKYAKAYGESKVRGALIGAIDQYFKKQVANTVVGSLTAEASLQVTRSTFSGLLSISSLKDSAIGALGVPNLSSAGAVFLWLMQNMLGDTPKRVITVEDGWRKYSNFEDLARDPDFCQFYNQDRGIGEGRKFVENLRDDYVNRLAGRANRAKRVEEWTTGHLNGKGSNSRSDTTRVALPFHPLQSTSVSTK